MAAYKSGETRAAILELRASLSVEPSALAALYLGSAHLKLEQLRLASTAFTQALSLETRPRKRKAIQALLDHIAHRDAGYLDLLSQPPGANVFVSTRPEAMGTTPFEGALPSGSHELRVELEGYETATLNAEFAFRKTTTLSVELVAKPCLLQVTPIPKAAKVSVDGAKAVASTDELMLAVGKHTITISHDGYITQSSELSCSPGKKLALPAPLVLLPGKVKIVLPAGTTVTLDGKSLELPTPDNGEFPVPAGKHEFVFSVPDREPWTTPAEVPSAGVVSLTLPKLPEPPPLQSDTGRYAGVDGGWNLGVNSGDLGSNAFVSQSGSGGVSPTSSVLAGLHVGYQMFDRLAVEAEVRYVSLPNELDTSVGLTYGLNAVYHFFSGSIRPFVQAGAGAYQSVSGDLGNNLDIRAHGGVGVRGVLSDRFALRADVRNVISDGFDGPADNVELLGGLELSWDKGGK